MGRAGLAVAGLAIFSSVAGGDALAEVFPDHSRRTGPSAPQGSSGESPEEDPELAAERDWWQSSIRAFCSDGSEGSFKGRPQKYRLASYMWLAAVNSSLVTMTGSGFEAFATCETRTAVQDISPGDEEALKALPDEHAPAVGRWLAAQSADFDPTWAHRHGRPVIVMSSA